MSTKFDQDGPKAETISQVRQTKTKHDKDMEVKEFERRARMDDRIFRLSAGLLLVVLACNCFVIFKPGSTPEEIATARALLTTLATAALGFLGGQSYRSSHKDETNPRGR